MKERSMVEAAGRKLHGRQLVTGAAVAVLAVVCLGGPGAAAASPRSAAPTAPGAEVSTHAGHLVLVGGALDENEHILQTFVNLADPDGRGPQRAHIAIVTAASYPAQNPEEAGDPEQDNAAANGIYYTELFERFGATAYAVPIDEAVNYADDPYVPDNADDPEVATAVRAATGVWFGGGDQMRYVRTLFDCAPVPHEAFTSCTDTITMTAIRSVLDTGGVIGGTSAGLTIQQGADMVTGGQPYEGWRDGATPGYFTGARLGYVPYGGFGFFEWGMLDSHFATWSRQPRMIRLALDPDVAMDRVVGLDETTALVVDRAAQTGRVIGRNGASVLDLSEAVLTHADSPAASVTGVRWTYLRAGDHIDLVTGTVQRAAGSIAVMGSGPRPPLQPDVWDTTRDVNVYSMRDLAVALVESAAAMAAGVTYEDDPTYRTVLVKDEATTAWTTPRGTVSFDGLEIRIEPVRR